MQEYIVRVYEDMTQWLNKENRLQLHRLDGPAIEAADRVGYWIDGVEYTKEEFIAKTHRSYGYEIFNLYR